MGKENYKRLGDYIQAVNIRNKELKVKTLLGVSIKKILIPSIANTIGTNMKTYKIIKRNQFAYGPVTSRNGDKISVALMQDSDEAIVSQAYTVFEVIDENELHPEYLMMWMRRSEFDRYARFKSHGSAREVFDWDEMCDTELPIPTIEKQQAIVKEYNTIVNRITLNEQLNKKLEDTAQTLYKHWFVDFEFPISKEDIERSQADIERSRNGSEQVLDTSLIGKPYKSSGGKMVFNEVLERKIPEGWEDSNFGDFVNTVNGYAFKSDEFSNCKTVPIIKIKSIQPPIVKIDDVEYYDNEITSKLERVIVENGDILITMTGSGVNQMNSAVGQVGRYFYSKIALMNQRVCKLQPKNNFSKEFIYLYISSEAIHMELLFGSTGSANQANISPEQVKSLKIIKPTEYVLICFEKTISKLFINKRISQQDKLVEIKKLLLSKMSKL